ncbi:ABC transporter permease [Antrihabitans cavernicola]|uniref:ABC transporter permease n=2 Tax=Antrihabitans cavernicola TaxID=2495913 RepID=A0A5A7SG06_9NOCA|nr:ABC transporter permease [Spelaeibacter cavernicola]
MSVKLHDRNFLVSTVVTLVIIVASILFSGWISGRATTIDVAVTGQDAATVLQTGQKIADSQDANVKLNTHDSPDLAGLEQQVRDGKVDVGLIPVDGGWRLIGKSNENTDATKYITAAAQQISVERNAKAAGTSVQQLQSGSSVTYDLLDPDGADAGTAKVVGFVFAFLFYLSSIVFGMVIAQSVVEEKQNRIVEILASAIPLRQLLVGKVLGSTAMALGQLVLFVAAGLIGMAATGRGSQIGQVAGAAGWFVVFFVVGFLALAALWAVAGSLSTRSEDLQSTATPLSVMIMAVLFIGIFVSGVGQVVASYVPLVSIVAMPSRVVAGTASWWEPLLSLAIMAATAYGVVVIAEKIYRRSLMQTQGRLSFRQALRVED